MSAAQFDKTFALRKMEYFRNVIGGGENDVIKGFIVAYSKVVGTIMSPDNMVETVYNAKNGISTIQLDTANSVIDHANELPDFYNGTNACGLDNPISLCTKSSDIIKFFKAVYSASASAGSIHDIEEYQNVQDLLDSNVGSLQTLATIKNAVAQYMTVSTNVKDIEKGVELAKILGIVDIESGEDVDNLYFTSSASFDISTASNNKYKFIEYFYKNKSTSNVESVISAYMSPNIKEVIRTSNDGSQANFGDSIPLTNNKLSDLFPNLKTVLLNGDLTMKVELEKTIVKGNSYLEHLFNAVKDDEGVNISYGTNDSIADTIQTVEFIKNQYTAAEDNVNSALSVAADKLISKFSIEYQEKMNNYFSANTFDKNGASSDFASAMKELFRDYYFITKILLNIPNKGLNILQGSNNKFNGWYGTDNGASLIGETLKKALIYQNLSIDICGICPFEEDDNIHGINQDTLSCQEQFNTIAYKLLDQSNCGSDKLDTENKIKDECLTKIAGSGTTKSMLYEIWLGHSEDLKFDLGYEYPS